MRHSQMGKCFFMNGDFYAGPWRDDMMDTTQPSNGPANHSQEGVLIQNDGMLRYFGGFKANQMHGWGVIYLEKFVSSEAQEQASEFFSHSPCQIHIFTGHFQNNQRHGRGELQVLRMNRSVFANNENVEYRSSYGYGSTILERFDHLYANGVLRQSNLLTSNQLQNYQPFKNVHFEDLTDQKMQLNQGMEPPVRKQHTNITLKQFKQTCLEELDSLTKINELVNNYPKIDKEWEADSQVRQWLFAIQMPQKVVDIFVSNQINGYALLEINKDDLEDMFQVKTDQHKEDQGGNLQNEQQQNHANQINSNYEYQQSDIEEVKNQNNQEAEEIQLFIIRILTQVEKLKIIWYKTLKKLKMIDECRDVLIEFGIIHNTQIDTTSAEAADDAIFDMNMDGVQKIQDHNNAELDPEINDEDINLRVYQKEHVSYDKHNMRGNNTDGANRSQFLGNYRDRVNNKVFHKQKSFFINKLAQTHFKNNKSNNMAQSIKLRAQNMNFESQTLSGGPEIINQNVCSAQQNVNDQNNSLMNFESRILSFTLKRSDANKSEGDIFLRKANQRNDYGNQKQVNQEMTFEDELKQMISTIDNVYDFLIPIDQIQLLGYENSDQTQADLKQPNNLIGKWFNGLNVTLTERLIRNRIQIEQFLQEVNILKKLRHPNIEMHLGITYILKTIKTNSDDKEECFSNNVYRFYIVTENIETQNANYNDQTNIMNQTQNLNQSLIRKVLQQSNNNSISLDNFLLETKNLLDHEQYYNAHNMNNLSGLNIEQGLLDGNIMGLKTQSKSQQMRIYRISQLNYYQLYLIVKQIIGVLKYMHKKSIAHGDVNARNFIVNRKSNDTTNQKSLIKQIIGGGLLQIKLKDFQDSFLDASKLNEADPSEAGSHLQESFILNSEIHNYQNMLCIRTGFETYHKSQVVPLYYKSPETMIQYRFMQPADNDGQLIRPSDESLNDNSKKFLFKNAQNQFVSLDDRINHQQIISSNYPNVHSMGRKAPNNQGSCNLAYELTEEPGISMGQMQKKQKSQTHMYQAALNLKDSSTKTAQDPSKIFDKEIKIKEYQLNGDDSPGQLARYDQSQNERDVSDKIQNGPEVANQYEASRQIDESDDYENDFASYNSKFRISSANINAGSVGVMVPKMNMGSVQTGPKNTSKGGMLQINDFGGNEESGYIGDMDNYRHNKNKSYNKFQSQDMNQNTGSISDIQLDLPYQSQLASTKQDIYQLGILILDLIASNYIGNLNSNSNKMNGASDNLDFDDKNQIKQSSSTIGKIFSAFKSKPSNQNTSQKQSQADTQIKLSDSNFIAQDLECSNNLQGNGTSRSSVANESQDTIQQSQQILQDRISINKALQPIQKHLLPGPFNKGRSISQIIGMQGYYWLLQKISKVESQYRKYQQSKIIKKEQANQIQWQMENQEKDQENGVLSSGTCSDDPNFENHSLRSNDEERQRNAQRDDNEQGKQGQFMNRIYSKIKDQSQKEKQKQRHGLSHKTDQGVDAYFNDQEQHDQQGIGGLDSSSNYYHSSINSQNLNNEMHSQVQESLDTNNAQAKNKRYKRKQKEYKNPDESENDINLHMFMQKPPKYNEYFQIDNIFGQAILEIAQNCTQYDQADRPSAFALWRFIEKFEQQVGAWFKWYQNQNQNQANQSMAFNTHNKTDNSRYQKSTRSRRSLNESGYGRSRQLNEEQLNQMTPLLQPQLLQSLGIEPNQFIDSTTGHHFNIQNPTTLNQQLQFVNILNLQTPLKIENFNIQI